MSSKVRVGVLRLSTKGGGDLPAARDTRTCRTPLLPALRIVGLRAQGDEIEVNLGALDATDQFKPTYELWTIRREAWLPPFRVSKPV